MTVAVLSGLVTVAITIFGALIMALFINYLPASPIQAYIEGANTFWHYAQGLGYFIPIPEILGILSGWVVCMGTLVVFKIVYEIVSKIAVE